MTRPGLGGSRRPFFGRDQVLRALENHLAAVQRTQTGRMIAVRGRRQIGKSTVVERFIQSVTVPYVFVSGVYGATTRQQLAAATAAIAEARRPLPNMELLTQTDSQSWREWLSRIAIAAKSMPIIVVLDEFPWLSEQDKSLEGELQAAWDRILEHLPILIVLIGSDVSMMARLAEHDRPLFGRIKQMVVPALNPSEISEALPTFGATAALDAYLVTGGYPRLVTELATSGADNVTEYVHANLRDAYSPLITTARISLDAEFPEPTAAYQVLSAIGADETANPAFKNVAMALADASERKAAETAVTRALSTLTETKGLIERELPAWAPHNSRLRRYRITDPYLRFWFRYIERNTDRIARGRSDLALAAFDRDWSSWRGKSIEPIIREGLTRLAAFDSRLTQVEQVSPWWNRDGSAEIDVVAMAGNNTAMLGTIKWREHGVVTDHDLQQLQKGQELVPKSSLAKLIAVSPRGKAVRGFAETFSSSDIIAAWGS